MSKRGWRRSGAAVAVALALAVAPWATPTAEAAECGSKCMYSSRSMGWYCWHYAETDSFCLTVRLYGQDTCYESYCNNPRNQRMYRYQIAEVEP